MGKKGRIGSVANATRAELAQHALKKVKQHPLTKPLVTAGVEILCPFCEPGQNKFKPGDYVFIASNRAHAIHTNCVKREAAKAAAEKAAAKGGNALDSVLQKACPDVDTQPASTPTLKQFGRDLVTKQDRQPERLVIECGKLRITIDMTD